MKNLALSVFALSLVAAPAIADTVSPNCTGENFRQLDFWVGDWDLKWQGGVGVNHIQKSFENCVIEEHFNGQPSQHLQGHSVSTYANGAWRQNWVDNQGGYCDLTGGPQADGTFVLENVRENDKTPYRRMVFENITADSLSWHWQGSDDGGKTWADRWVIEYTRVKP